MANQQQNDSNGHPLLPLRPACDTPLERLPPIAPWRLVAPSLGESCRWECYDGRWVSLRLGDGDYADTVVVTDSNGRQALVDNYEGAIHLSRTWPTI